MPDRTATPEELLDQWLDALNEPGGATPPAPAAIAGLAGVALDYRRALGTAPGPAAAPPERNGKMHHAHALAHPNATSWRIVARPKRQKPSWSSWLATAAMIALLIGLVGGAAVRTWGLPGGDDPGHLAGVAPSPGASPAAGTLSCAAPGYRPVVEGDVNEAELAAIGETETPLNVDGIYFHIPTANGEIVTLPNTWTPLGGPMWSNETTLDASGEAIIRNVDTGEEWGFPDAGTPFPGLYIPPYLVVPANGDATDFRIIDTESGEEALVSDLRGEPLPAPARISPIAVDSDSYPFRVPAVLLFSFDEAATYPYTGPEASDPDAEPGAMGRNALYLPPSLHDAGFLPDAVYARYAQDTAYSVETNRLAYRSVVNKKPAIVVTQPGTEHRLEIHHPEITDGALPLMFSEDGSSLIVSRPGAIITFDLQRGPQSIPLVASSDEPFMPIAHNAASMNVLVAYPDRHIAIVNAASGEVTEFPDITVPASEYLPTDPRQRLSSESDLYELFDDSTGTVRIVNLVTGNVSPETSVLNPGEGWIDAAFQPQFQYREQYPHAVWPSGYASLDPEAALRVTTTAGDDESWSIPAPDGFEVDESQVAHLFANPDATCIVLQVAMEAGRTVISSEGTSNRIIATWIAPLEPGAQWTRLENAITAWFPTVDDAEPKTLPAQDFATPATTTRSTGLSCASPGYLPVVSGDLDAAGLAAFGGPDGVIRATGDGVFVPLPDGDTRELPQDSVIYPVSDLALAIHDDNSATVTRISTGESWEYPAVEPRVEEQPYWDFFTNGRYVVGPTDDSRTDWLITDTLTGDTRTTADILGEPFTGPLDLMTHASSETGDLWLLQFMTLVFPDETPPADDVHAPGYLVIPGSLDDAWFNSSSRRAEPIDTVVSPEGTSYIVNQAVRDPRTGERVDAGTGNATFVGELVGYLDESTLITYRHDTVNTVDIGTGVATPIYTAPDLIQSVAWDADAGRLAVGSGVGDESTWALLDLATGEATPLPELDGYQLANVSLFGPVARVDGAAAFTQATGGDREISVRALDMRGGTVSPALTTRTDTRVRGLESTVPAWSDGRYVRTTDGAGTLTFIDAASGTAVTLPQPDGVAVPEGGRLDISVVPDGACATLTPLDESGNSAGNTWIAPIEPGATWTELPFAIDAWVEAEGFAGPQTLPAQDFATPAAFVPDLQVTEGPRNLRERPVVDADIVNILAPDTPLMALGDEQTGDDGERWVHVRTETGDEGWVVDRYLEPYAPAGVATPATATPATSALSCASPGYRAIVRGPVDPADLALLGPEPIDVASDTLTAANGTEIEFDGDWGIYPNSTLIISGKDIRSPDTVTNLLTGVSRPLPETAEDPNGGVAIPFTVIGPWLFIPTDDSNTNWHIIDTTTGDERLTSDVFGAAFSEPRQPSVPGPWLLPDGAAAIVAFSATAGSNLVLPALVLPTADIDDVWALDSADADAARSGAIAADGSRIAYVPFVRNDRVVVLDGFTGERLGSYRAPESDLRLETVGLTGDDDKLVVRNSRTVWTVDLATGEIATVFDPGADIHGFEFDTTTGTALANAGNDFALFWIDPATGDVKELDAPSPMRVPHPQFGWALIQTREDDGVSYALLDMTTGELAAEPISTGPDQDGNSIWITGGNETGVFVVRPETDRLIVLDGPRGRAFELPAPEGDPAVWAGVAIGISPNGACLVYTRVGQGDEPGTSWIAPLEPDAAWAKLPFELAYWVEVPAAPTGYIAGILPDNLIPIVETSDPEAVDQTLFGTVRGTGPTPPPGITLPLPNGEVLELPDAVDVVEIPDTTLAVVERFDTSRATIDLATGETVIDNLPPATERERWFGVYIYTPNHDGTAWTITDIRTGERIDTAEIGDAFPQAVAPVPVSFGIGDIAHQLVRFELPDPDGDVGGATPPVATPAAGAPGSTLVIPGSLADARFLQRDAVTVNWLVPSAAFAHPDGEPALLAYATNAPGERVRVENAVTGEIVAAFSDTEIGAEGPVSIAGFDDDAATLTVWSQATVSRLPLDGSGDISRYAVDDGWIDLAFPGDGTLLASVNPFYDAPEGTADWRLLDLATGAWQPLPELDGYRYDRIAPDAGIIALSAREGLATTGVALVDLTTGHILAAVPDADVGAETAMTMSRDGSVYVITGHTGDAQTTGYALDADSGNSWLIVPPEEGNVIYGVSPDGSLLTASTSAGDGWVAPATIGATWTKLPEGHIVDWLWLPDDD